MLSAEGVLSLVRLPPADRDVMLERALGIDGPVSDAPPGQGLIGYHASALAAVCRAVLEVQLTADDVFIDLGAGRGKVVAVAQAVTGARCRGVELQRSLVQSAAPGVELHEGDARTARLDDGTVFYLYAPFEGAVLAAVLARLHEVARRHSIVVCALGVTLTCEWLVPRASDAFWLTVLDSVVPGVAPRAVSDVAFDERLRQLALEL